MYYIEKPEFRKRLNLKLYGKVENLLRELGKTIYFKTM